jgi:hypothetical protein
MAFSYGSILLSTVADPGCLYRIQGQKDAARIPNPHKRIKVFLTQKLVSNLSDI